MHLRLAVFVALAATAVLAQTKKTGSRPSIIIDPNADGTVCGDGICLAGTENCVNCPTDCRETSSLCCGVVSSVGDGCAPRKCNSRGYVCQYPPWTEPGAFCGDGICEEGLENCMDCPEDCYSNIPRTEPVSSKKSGKKTTTMAVSSKKNGPKKRDVAAEEEEGELSKRKVVGSKKHKSKKTNTKGTPEPELCCGDSCADPRCNYNNRKCFAPIPMESCSIMFDGYPEDPWPGETGVSYTLTGPTPPDCTIGSDGCSLIATSPGRVADPTWTCAQDENDCSTDPRKFWATVYNDTLYFRVDFSSFSYTHTGGDGNLRGVDMKFMMYNYEYPDVVGDYSILFEHEVHFYFDLKGDSTTAAEDTFGPYSGGSSPRTFFCPAMDVECADPGSGPGSPEYGQDSELLHDQFIGIVNGMFVVLPETPFVWYNEWTDGGASNPDGQIVEYRIPIANFAQPGVDMPLSVGDNVLIGVYVDNRAPAFDKALYGNWTVSECVGSTVECDYDGVCDVGRENCETCPHDCNTAEGECCGFLHGVGTNCSRSCGCIVGLPPPNEPPTTPSKKSGKKTGGSPTPSKKNKSGAGATTPSKKNRKKINKRDLEAEDDFGVDADTLKVNDNFEDMLEKRQTKKTGTSGAGSKKSSKKTYSSSQACPSSMTTSKKSGKKTSSKYGYQSDYMCRYPDYEEAGSWCGDLVCEAGLEDCWTCPEDCMRKSKDPGYCCGSDVDLCDPDNCNYKDKRWCFVPPY